jgi:hypothetical protein
MKITRSREHTVNLGNYENVKVGAFVELTEDDIRALGPEPSKAVKYADDMLDKLLDRDLKEALANVPAKQPSHLETWAPGE